MESPPGRKFKEFFLCLWAAFLVFVSFSREWGGGRAWFAPTRVVFFLVFWERFGDLIRDFVSMSSCVQAVCPSLARFHLMSSEKRRGILVLLGCGLVVWSRLFPRLRGRVCVQGLAVVGASVPNSSWRRPPARTAAVSIILFCLACLSRRRFWTLVALVARAGLVLPVQSVSWVSFSSPPPRPPPCVTLRGAVLCFRGTLQLSQGEMESAVAGTMDTFRSTLQTALDRAKATAGEVGAVLASGGVVDREGLEIGGCGDDLVDKVRGKAIAGG